MISLPFPKIMQINQTTKPPVVIRTVTYHGPNINPTEGEYQAWCLKDFVFHIRKAMEDKEHVIAIWRGYQCVGGWVAYNDVDVEEGDMVPVGYWYKRVKPGSLEMKWIFTDTKGINEKEPEYCTYKEPDYCIDSDSEMIND